jgi:outer membrane protein assembly factor BamE
MKQILITLFLPASILFSGCSSLKDFTLVHTPDIEQGNIITPEMVAKLEPGMSKRQVRFVLGTPTLIDVFHPERWDYNLTLKQRNKAIEIKHFRVYFVDGELLRYEGDIEPTENLEQLQDKKEIVLSVPDHEEIEREADQNRSDEPFDPLEL